MHRLLGPMSFHPQTWRQSVRITREHYRGCLYYTNINIYLEKNTSSQQRAAHTSTRTGPTTTTTTTTATTRLSSCGPPQRARDVHGSPATVKNQLHTDGCFCTAKSRNRQTDRDAGIIGCNRLDLMHSIRHKTYRGKTAALRRRFDVSAVFRNVC